VNYIIVIIVMITIPICLVPKAPFKILAISLPSSCCPLDLHCNSSACTTAGFHARKGGHMLLPSPDVYRPVLSAL
jgi:hypothetical protein